ncbi:hypothetical protein E8E13_001631 [Curvularia kusanoi]|uniref:Uncharacterized protein n=1 Tax=Curvularia kusanoi TaxID=90978 RepID=A0A9P4T4P7_CURKU|nr:hypothetical protein E8E13_001631 [Curvularia kusanoi]
MPPRKEDLSEAALRRKVHDHGIRFKGPVPPEEWPNEHKHHFDVAHTIQFLRYDAYKTSFKRKTDYQKRVRSLRRQVQELLDDVNANEPSWRQLERDIFKRLDQSIFCGKCKKDLTKVDYEANCTYHEDQAKLNAKRSSRRE